MKKKLTPNPGKRLTIVVEGVTWQRFPVRTKVVTKRDTLETVIRRSVRPHLQDGDLLFIAEKIVAITQGRAFPVKHIKPSRLARFLVRFVYRSPYGIGLGSVWTMELALRDAGVFRILLAAAAAALTKPFGIRGAFYLVAGRDVAAIDGPCNYTLPPYNRYAKLAPAKPHVVAKALADTFEYPVVIIDANDLGVRVLGKSSAGIPDAWACALFRDNPLGQAREQTPFAVVRPVRRGDAGNREPHERRKRSKRKQAKKKEASAAHYGKTG